MNNIPLTTQDLDWEGYHQLTRLHEQHTNVCEDRLSIHRRDETIMGFKLSEHEEAFKLVPVAIRYRCELCNEGEMIADPNEMIVLSNNNGSMRLRRHVCNKCHGEMRLPKTYPYVEWLSIDDYQHLVNSEMIKEV